MATNTRRLGSVVVVLAAVSLGLATAVKAQDFPQRPITFVVGLGAGGGQDINSRIYADAMSRGFGQRVVVDNKTGAGGGVAAAYVQNAAPDGYTLLTVSGLQHVYVPATQPGLYEPLKGFAPVSLMFEIISALTVPEDMPVQNAAEFIAYGRKKPGGLTIGAPGPGSPPHMFGALIGEATGVPVQVIQYRGSSQAMTDLAGGRIDMAFPTYGLGAPFIAEKKVKPIAVAADKRWSQFPDLPTLVEAGLVKHMVAMWFGLLAPAGTPPDVVNRIQQEVAKALNTPAIKEKLLSQGAIPSGNTPAEFAKHIDAEHKKWAQVVKASGAKVD